MSRQARRPAVLGCAAALAISLFSTACQTERVEPLDGDRPSRAERRLDEELTPTSSAPQREGLAAAILIDTSGSMEERVTTGAGREEKIVTARRAAVNLVEQFARYALDHPNDPVEVGIYEFSERSRQPDCRAILPMGAPDLNQARDAVISLRAAGGTPIGNAMVAAKLALDATGLSRRHLLVVTDGDNTDGHEPEDVAAAINRRPESERPSIYFVAFDIDAGRFDRVRDAGALVLGAANARELTTTLDALLQGKILVE